MAKILLVTKRLTPTAIKLAQALRHQQHLLTVITSRDEDAALPDGIEVMRPFRRWSVTEALRATPVVLGLNPEIVHVLFEEDRLNPAQAAICLLAKAIPNCVLTTSVLHIRHGLRRRNPMRYLLQESDIVTCPSVESLGALRGLNVRSHRQGRGILPPALNLATENDDGASASDLSKLLEKKNYFVLPFFETKFTPQSASFRKLQLLASHRHVVLLGTFAHWTLRDRKRFQNWMQAQGLDAQWTLSGDIGRQDLRRLLKSSEAFILAGHSLSPLELTDYFLSALQAEATLILDNRQSMVHPQLWKNGENCWILSADRVITALQELLAQGSLRRKPATSESLGLQKDLIDVPLNELNRLYNKALSQKHIL